MSRCVSAGSQWLIASAAAFWLVQATSAADKGQALPEGWEVRTFRVPEGFFWWAPAGSGIAREPELPAAGAPESVQVAYAKACTERARKVMEAWGVILVQGSVVLSDTKSGTVAVRTTTEQMQSIGWFLWQALRNVPRILALRVDIVQTDAPTMCRITQESAKSGDDASAWRAISELVEKGGAKSVGALRVETRSGVRVFSEAGPEVLQMSAATFDEKGRVEGLHEKRHAGLRFEADPAIGGERDFVDVNFALEFHYAPPTQRTESAGPTGPPGKTEWPLIDYHMAKVSTATSMMSGGTRLIGVWTPEGTPEFADSGIMQAAFLHANVTRLVPPENNALGPLLAAVADKVSPIPPPPRQAAKAQQDGKPPTEMQMRSFDVPSSFLTAAAPDAGEAPADPFAPVVPVAPPTDPFAPAGRYLPNPGRISSAEKVLKSFGVELPEGSRAEFNSTTNTLIVTSTPCVLDQIEVLVDSGCRIWPRNVTATLHIVEADGATLRRLSRECVTEADHTGAWIQMEGLIANGSAKCLRTAHLGTRSGGRATFEAGEDHMSPGNVHFGGAKAVKEEPAASPATDTADRNDPKASAPGTPSDLADIRLMNLKTESRVVGTRLEFDPVIGPDGRVLDVNLTLEHHYAPPTLHQAPKGKTRRIELPATDFHFAKITTAITTTSGMTKLLGIWKPEGAPEFDGKDVMQAAFLRVDVVPVEEPGVVEAKETK